MVAPLLNSNGIDYENYTGYASDPQYRYSAVDDNTATQTQTQRGELLSTLDATGIVTHRGVLCTFPPSVNGSTSFDYGVTATGEPWWNVSGRGVYYGIVSVKPSTAASRGGTLLTLTGYNLNATGGAECACVFELLRSALRVPGQASEFARMVMK